ncbi:MAG: murein biosynthesis protein MurJ, partial [Micrococcaceae bacterium]|nr:murein biosynthesis protein MurJ [Micrococcaceae bacterium]
SMAVVGVLIAYALAAALPAAKIALGIALLYGVTNIISAVIAHVLVVRRYGDYGTREVVNTYIRIGWYSAISGAVGALVLWFMGGYTSGFAWDSIFSALISIAVVGSVMAVVYLLLLKAANVPELDDFIGGAAKRIPDLGRRLRR